MVTSAKLVKKIQTWQVEMLEVLNVMRCSITSMQETLVRPTKEYIDKNAKYVPTRVRNIEQAMAQFFGTDLAKPQISKHKSVMFPNDPAADVAPEVPVGYPASPSILGRSLWPHGRHSDHPVESVDLQIYTSTVLGLDNLLLSIDKAVNHVPPPPD